jgi:hypothetical protein
VPAGSVSANGDPAATDCGARRWDQATMLSISAGKAASWGRFDSEGSKAITATRLPAWVPEAIRGPSELHAAAVIVAGRASRRAAPAPIVSDEMSAPSSSGLAGSVPLMRLSFILPRNLPAGKLGGLTSSSAGAFGRPPFGTKSSSTSRSLVPGSVGS